jgi:hypothetical protein
MNYVLIHWAFGRKSMEMTVNKMTEPCNILARKNDGSWWEYIENADVPDAHGKAWERRRPAEITEILSGNNKVINWGNHIFSDNSKFSLNVPSAVANASNKTFSRRILRKAKIAIPATYFYNEDFRESLPVIARPAYHHAGNNFYVLNNTNEYVKLSSKYDLKNWYFSEIFPKTHEFRVHCAHGKILQVSNKPLAEGELRANHSVVEESWRALKWSEYNDNVCVQSLKAIEALCLDYGAVDIMYNSANNSVAICEVNTSPSITTEYSSGKYAEYFSWVIRHKFPAHFAIEPKYPFYSNMLRD